MDSIPSGGGRLADKLSARNLSCQRGDRRLFSGLDVDLATGGLLHVSGPNGSGKTSLLRIICGLLQPTSGTIEWNGREKALLGDDYFQMLAYVGHLNGVKDELSVTENLQFSARLAGLPHDAPLLARALDAFAFGGSRHLPARFLSQGQKRRLALARLHLSADRPLWVLDEPLAALDANGIDIVKSTIEAHVARGGMALLTTHQDIQVPSTTFQRIVLGR